MVMRIKAYATLIIVWLSVCPLTENHSDTQRTKPKLRHKCFQRNNAANTEAENREITE